MDISNTEQWSPASHVYDDLCVGSSLSRVKTPTRSASIIGYAIPHTTQSLQIKRPTVSLIFPPPTTLETIIPINDAKQSSALESNELNGNDLPPNEDQSFILKEDDYLCVCWTIREVIQLFCVALFACLIGMFVFTLIFYVFDLYWLEHPIMNNSSWWSLDNNGTIFTEPDYDLFGIAQTISYDDEY